MKVGVIGCGYVFDHYMATWGRHPILELAGVADRDPARTAAVARHYGVRVYDDVAAMLADPEVEMVVNLTSIDSHREVVSAALEAGKHVYTEKPVTEDAQTARDLYALAEARGLHLAAAPCNVMSDTVQTLWRAVRDGAVGKVRLVYAEFDDNPIYLMKPEGWRSRSGAPWPWKDEYEHGCTVEHAGYHLTWLVAMFGPVARVTAFSKATVPDKAEGLAPPDSADFSVACLDFESGVTARLTCSIVAPYDQRMRVIGDAGELWTDTYRHYVNPVFLERFTQVSLNARKARWVRQSPVLQRLFGVGGRRVPLIRRPWDPDAERPAGGLKGLIRRFRKDQLGEQDKCLGVAELARAIESGGPNPLPPDFCLHVNELTLAIHRAGTEGRPIRLETGCAPLAPMGFAEAADRSRAYPKPGWAARLGEGIIARMHRH